MRERVRTLIDQDDLEEKMNKLLLSSDIELFDCISIMNLIKNARVEGMYEETEFCGSHIYSFVSAEEMTEYIKMVEEEEN